jgi:hypothetical protein
MTSSSVLKYWLTAGVEAGFEWPDGEVEVSYCGDTFVFRPPTSDAVADIQLGFTKGGDKPPPFVRISRFLSILSWWWQSPARVGFCAASTAKAMRVGDRNLARPQLVSNFKIPDQLPVIANRDAQLALALYREAIGIRNVSYEFLGYFRILNIGRNKPVDQIEWINETVPMLKEHRSLERLQSLRSEDHIEEVGSYLYGCGRCAVAHAAGDPIVDPDGGDDYVRLQRDMHIARELAEFRIEKEFGVPNWISFRRAEAEKFKRLRGSTSKQ